MKKMLYSATLILTLGVLLLINACSPDADRYKVELPPKDNDIHLSINDVKGLYQGENLHFKSDVDSIFGVVISDVSAGNIPGGILVLEQNGVGIAISLKDVSDGIPYVPGDSIAIDISGGALTKQGGNLIITGPTLSDIEKLGSGKSVKPTPVTLSDLKENFDRYSSSMVQVAGADIVPAPESNETYSGIKNLSDGSTDPGAIKLYATPSSDVAKENALANATFAGIAFYGTLENTDSLLMEIWPQDVSDISNTSQPRYSDIIITGFMANPRGVDQKKPGDVTKYGGGEEDGGVTVRHDGGYEYMQLMALEDINFSQTPYSVVIAREGPRSATAKGWAEGGHVTYKFNLTSGEAKAGTFFYVGSSSKRLAGYWPEGTSQDISGANWIRSIVVYDGGTNNVTGDGFGYSTTALLANGETNEGVGIAVFEGTSINAASVPIDAVFYNPPANGFPLPYSYSYRVPIKSDLYSAEDESGNAQPFYGEGTNTFTVSHDASCCDASHWAKMGGIFSPNAIIAPRTSPTVVALDVNSDISDIESASGVTVFRK